MIASTSSRLLAYNKLILWCSKHRCKNKHAFHVKLGRAYNTNVGKEVVTFSDGKKLTVSSGEYARFASGTATATLGDTSVMVAAVSTSQVASDSSFVPMSVYYRQKAAAAGRIPTNFFRKELAPTPNEILASRLIDRSVRPLFPEEYCHEIQLTCNMLAVDSINDPDIVAINAASAALSVSDIPWNGPVGAVRIGLIDDKFLVNPSRRELHESKLNLVVTVVQKNIVMLEASAHNVPDDKILHAIKLGVRECQGIILSISELKRKCGKEKRKFEKSSEPPKSIMESVRELAEPELRRIFRNPVYDKIERDNAVNELRNSIFKSLKSDDTINNTNSVEKAFNKITKEIFRSLIFETNIRCDGRLLDELRDIKCKVDLFKPLHGSAMFQRGQTQVLCTVTLDSVESAMKMDTITMLISGIKEKNFFLHYEFPPYATNSTGRVGGVDRREIGHGMLAERGLQSVVPKDFPFTVRLTSEVLESNGSSSMASVCGGSLALLDAGVPISASVAGVAMGLVTKYDATNNKIEDYRILTDLLGIEDYLGDMDFKLAGTTEGITAIQTDVKVPGISLKIVAESIQRSKMARSKILKIMNQAINAPKMKDKSKMPVIEKLDIPAHHRGKFVGIGGANIKKIFFETGVTISPQDEYTYTLFAPNQDAMTEAKEMIETYLKKDKEPNLEFGGIYTAKIVEIRETGAMVQLYPGMPPTLISNSQLDHRKVHHPSALGLTEGQEIQVKYFGRDPVTGRMRLSRKVLQEPVTITKSFMEDNS